MGIVLLQLSEALPRRVSFTASSVLQSLTRPGASGLGTALLLVHGDASGVAVATGVPVADATVGLGVFVVVAAAAIASES